MLYFLFVLCGALFADCGGYHNLFVKSPSNASRPVSLVDYQFEDPFFAPQTRFGVSAGSLDSYYQAMNSLSMGRAPLPSAVDPAAFVNAFRYGAAPDRGITFNVEMGQSPWSENLVALVSVRSAEPSARKGKGKRVVFLVDTSGSMGVSTGLDLAKTFLSDFFQRMTEQDRAAIVTYGGGYQVLEGGRNVIKSQEFVRKLQAVGFTESSPGIVTAYEIAARQFQADAGNWVVLITDGDLRGIGMPEETLSAEIVKRAGKGIGFSAIHVGAAWNAEGMKRLTDPVGGSYVKVQDLASWAALSQGMGFAAPDPVAREFEARLEFDSGNVAAWRRIGREDNRTCWPDTAWDSAFMDSSSDTLFARSGAAALYEIIPVTSRGAADFLERRKGKKATASRNLFKVTIQYLDAETSRKMLLEQVVPATSTADIKAPGPELRLAEAAGALGMILHHSKNRGRADVRLVKALMRGTVGAGAALDRVEFLRIVQGLQNDQVSGVEQAPKEQVCRASPLVYDRAVLVSRPAD